jgi:drug/metabolite transporter (DMT)-like permease
VVSLQVADLAKTERPQTIVFYFALVTAPICAIGLPFVSQGLSQQQMLLLLAIGVIGTIGQLLLTASLRYGKVASVIVMDYSSLFWATLYGWFIFDALPGSWTWIGAPLIVFAGILITWREHVLSRRAIAERLQATGT